jgi:hypothetical protein
MSRRPGVEPRQIVLERAAHHVRDSVPDLSLCAAMEFVAEAVVDSTLRPLEAHLARHPDALTSGSSSTPVAVQRLAALLVAAGHTTVTIPSCLRCKAPKILHHIVDGGRVCDNCRRYFHCAPCSRCGKDRSIAKRDDHGRPLCSSCVPRKRGPCGQCGRVLAIKARRSDGAALCPNCYRTPHCTCIRCGEDAPTYAHTDDGPICKSCYTRPKRRCGGCGEVRGIDRTARGTEPDLCNRCLTRPRHPCVICGAAHPAHPDAQQPVCLRCRDDGHVLEPQLTESPTRVRRRQHETAHDALEAKLRIVLSHPEHGIAEQLVPLIAVFAHVPNPSSTMRWLHRRAGGAKLLHELAQRAHHESLSHELLDQCPPSYALHRLRDLLVHAGILAERDELLERIEQWLEHALGERPAHHIALVRPFATWHVLRRARRRSNRRPVTVSAATYVRSQIAISLEFLTWLDERGKTLPTTDQADIDVWLDGGSEYRYFVTTFIEWSKGRKLCSDLTVPQRPSAGPSNLLTEEDRWDMLDRCLHDDELPLDVRVTGALVLLYGRTTTSIATLTCGRIDVVDQETYLRFDEGPALVPPALAALLTTLRDNRVGRETFYQTELATRFLFPGRSPGRPMASAVLARKLRHHGIEPLPARHSARSAWARDIPAPIAADLLGVNISTATKWSSRTRRDWADYLLARSEEQQDES